MQAFLSFSTLLANHPLFGTKHLILAALSYVLCIALFFVVRKWKFRNVCKAMFYIGIVSELVKIFYFTIANEDKFGGILPKTDLPFHLCSIQIIFIAILYLYNKPKVNKFLLSFMRPSCLFGGIAAILIATDSSRNGTWVITAQYFLYHVALVVFALYLYGSKEVRFDIKDYFNCLKFLVVLMFFAFYINSILLDSGYDTGYNINFMYVAGPPQPNLPYLNDNNGWLSYIIRYAVLILGCISLSYIVPIVNAIHFALKNRKAAKNADAADNADTAENIDAMDTADNVDATENASTTEK